MKKLYHISSCLILMLVAGFQVTAQTNLTTTTTFLNNNGSGTVTFNLQNNNTSGVIITDIAGLTGSSGTQNVEFWYKATPISGSPGNISTANGWTLISSGTIIGVANTSNTNTQPFFTGLNFLLPANTTYGFAVFAAGQRYYTMSSAVTISAGGVDFLSGPGIGYGGGTPPATPTNSPRGWIGTITFMPALPCTSPPTPGTATSSATNVCTGGTFNLGLTGNSMGTGQTYQWQTATSIAGPWTNLGPSTPSPSYTATATATLYYRSAVTCGTSTAYSTPVQVTVPALFPGGTYTINAALPTAGTNFQTFTAAVSAISCGIAGPVVFNVVSSSGPYNEQITIPAINTTATNTVTFNGNNNVLTYAGNSTNYSVLQLYGADYFRINQLTVQPATSASYGYGIVLSNSANHNIIDSCTVNNGTTGTSSLFAGIVVGGSQTSATSGSSPCDSNIISNNTVIGGYYCVTSVGTSSGMNQGNQFLKNVIRDFYTYGMYLYYNNDLIVAENELHRMTRANPSTFYGLYHSSGNQGSRISKNRLHDPFGGSPTASGTAYLLYNSASATLGNENVFSNNILYNLNGHGSHYCIYSLGNYGRFYFNTVSSDYTAATSGSTYGYYQASNYSGIEFKNNIISITRGGSGVKYCAYHSSSGYTTVMNNNDYYSTAANKFYRAGVLANLSNWQAATSQDAASMALDPQFTAPSTGDLTPTNLAMDNIGTPIAGITTDITGAGRNAVNPDAGAFEFNNFCAPPTNLAATSITVNSANLSWSGSSTLGYEYVLDQIAGNPAGAGTLTIATAYVANGLSGGTSYYLHVRTKCGPTNFSAWVTLPFATCPLPVITPQSSVTFCNGGSVVLNASAGSAYQWKLNSTNIAGATSSSYTATSAGSYTVTITSANGCVTTSAAVNVQVTFPPSTINPAGPVNVCPNNPIVLSAPAGTGLTYQWMLNGTPISGATAVTHSTIIGGNYTVQVSSGPNCNSITQTPTTVTVLPLPAASVSSTGGAAICPGGTVLLSANTGASLSYQWMLNGANLAGATSDSYTANAIGSYTVKVTSASTGCYNVSAPLVVTTAPVPTAIISAPGQVTACDSTQLQANAGSGYSYQWLNNGLLISGATGISHTATSAGLYTVQVTNSNGCSMVSSPINVNLNPSPEAVITYSSPLVFCEGGAVVLNTLSASGLIYQWMRDGIAIPGASTLYHIAGETGTYTVYVSNNFGCSKVSGPVQVKVHPKPEPAITRNGSVLSTGAYMTYQWYLNMQTIGGANYQNYTATVNGAYAVAVTDSNGCTSISPVEFVNSLGIAGSPAGGHAIKVYPNPSADIVHVEAAGVVDLLVRDLQGKIVLRQPAANSVNLTQFSDGMYLLYISDQAGRLLQIEKLVKRR